MDKQAPTAATPLIALPVLILDLETTGLDVRKDRVVQIGAIKMSGAEVEDTAKYDQLVNPETAIPGTSSRIHGLTDSDVVAAPTYPEISETLRKLLAGRVVIGHHIGFDLAVLRHEAVRISIPWQDPPTLDIAQLLGALDPSLRDLGLETIAMHLGINIQGRHTAAGDCQATAEVWAKLLPLLRDAEVRTLGEAYSLAATRDDLLIRQAEAGWHTRPNGIAINEPGLSKTRLDSYVFQRRIKKLMTSPAAMVTPETSLLDAAKLMVDKRIGALLVAHPENSPQGIITERDLLKASAENHQDFASVPVSSIMSSPVEHMADYEMLYRALGRMDRLGIRHLCVTDSSGAVVGVVSQRDLLHHRARSVDVLGDAIGVAADIPSLAAAYARAPEVAARLVFEGLGGKQVARVLSSELRAITARAAELTLAKLSTEGRGQAPASWCLLVLGSGGRSESLLGADQDNALIHTGADADDAWFAEFGAGIADILDDAGVERCKGGVMAATPEWRGTAKSWRARLDDWLRRASPEDLLNVDIFFDLVPVAGDSSLAAGLRTDALKVAATSRTFLNLLAQSVVGMAPRLGFFGGFTVTDGRIDLKRDGLLPLVSTARTLALKIGSKARATPERLRDLVAAERMSEKDAAVLIGLHGLLLDNGVATTVTRLGTRRATVR